MVADGNPIPASLIGQTLGNYAVDALIGRGAAGTVYLARDTALGRPAALKVLLGSLARNPDQVRRFQAEAQAAAPLQHPNIVRIYEAGVRRGVPFIAMEYIEGEPLDRFLHRHGTLEWQHALHIAHQVAQALDCAHTAGIVHRDIKPANILLDRQGRVRLTDFGIASASSGDLPGGKRFDFSGTPEYMSPEQCGGWSAGTPASDLYSLGITLYQMISGRLPFEGETLQALIAAISHQKAKRLNQIMLDVPDDVARLVAHLMEKAPEARPISARLLCATIERLQGENGGVSAMPEALNTFIREQTKPRQVLGKKKAQKSRPVRKPHQRGARVSFARLAWGAALCAAIGTVGAVGYSYEVIPKRLPPPAPKVEAARVFDDGQGTLSVPLPASHWTVESLAWAGNQGILTASITGMEGSAWQGAQGILSIDPQEGTVFSTDAPAGALRDANYWDHRLPVVYSGALFTAPGEDPLSGALLTQRVVHDTPTSEAWVHTYAHYWNESAPRNQVMFRAPVSTWSPPLSSPWASPSAGVAVASPDGHTLCLVLHDVKEKGNYLAEHDLRWGDTTRIGARLTKRGTPIVPGSVRYSPAGDEIAFLREKSPVEKELWIVPSGGEPAQARVVSRGNLHRDFAFNADGTRIAASFREEAGWHTEILSTTDGMKQSDLGEGTVSSGSWSFASGFLFLVTNDAAQGTVTLWEAAESGKRNPVLSAGGQTLGGAAISKEGRWVALAVTRGEGACILILDRSKQGAHGTMPPVLARNESSPGTWSTKLRGRSLP